MVNAEFSTIYRFVKLLVNEGFLAVIDVHASLLSLIMLTEPHVMSSINFMNEI